MIDLFLVDSNVLAYAFDKSSDKHPAAEQVLARLVLEGRGAVSIQNLAEFSRIMTEKVPNRLPFGEARVIVSELSDNLAVLRYDQQTVADALLVCKERKMHFYDALLVSTMQNEGIREIVTEDEKEFKKISWLRVTNPFKV